jgi:hypothetical protein
LSTPVPKRTNTPTPRPQTPTVTASGTATATATKAPAKATAAPDLSSATVQLLQPPDGHTGYGVITFQWATDYQLPEGQGYELVFWRAGGDPIRDGRGYAGITQGTSSTIDWDELEVAPDAYQWGVLLVEKIPYARLRYMGGGFHFQYTGRE